MEDTIFHKIIRREIPTKILKESEDYIVIHDIAPQAPVHLLIIPKKTMACINCAEPEDQALLGKLILAAKDVAAELGIKEKGYRLVINTGDDGGQTVNQLHVHLLAGRQLQWPPG